MSVFNTQPLAGVIPATLLAFDPDYRIDEAESRRHLRDVAAVAGLSAITVNGHASEVHACSLEEQRRILAFSLDEVGDRHPLINGIYADGSILAGEIARMAEREGASIARWCGRRWSSYPTQRSRSWARRSRKRECPARARSERRRTRYAVLDVRPCGQ